MTTTTIALDGSNNDTEGNNYAVVVASQTTSPLVGYATGAVGSVGDWVENVVIVPLSTSSPGVVTLYDGSTSASVPLFVGGASSITSLSPVSVNLGMRSQNGKWLVTTGQNVKAVITGNFS